MLNYTFNWPNFFRLNFLIAFLLLGTYNVSAQFYTKHYIAPAPWQYFSKSNEIVIATNSTTTVNITLSKSDGTLETTLTATKGNPAIYRFKLLAKDLPMNALNTVLTGAGLIVTSTGPTSINMRNVASDDNSGDNNDAYLKGNAALTSFGDAGIGVRFRVGYYRDGSLGNFGSFGDQRPIYSIMATADNTTVKVNNVITATLNAGQSYLFKAPIGTLVESSNPCVMNTAAAIDTPDGCGDSAYNQIPPESVLGTEYFIERGKGNDTAEKTTVVATKDNTNLVINTYSTTGVLTATTNVTLATAGSFHTFNNGVLATPFSASRVSADKKIVVYSGTAQSCEVDISTIAPVSECGGSNFIETAKFRNYGTGTLPYFGYILLRSATDAVTVNGTNIETISGISARHQLGTTGWYLINFEDTQIGSPNVLSISSNTKMTVSIVQQGGGFSMAGFFSNFAAQPEDPTLTYISGGGCTNNTAELTTPVNFAPYQWYLNGAPISGANSATYTATKTGAYSVASTLVCGAQTQSKPVSVTLCTDLGITKAVDNAAPCIGSNVEFTVKVNNLGGNNISGVSVNDLLPSGYTYVSSVPSIGSYNSGTGVWSIGDLDGGTEITLKIIATVNASGIYTNTASLPSSIDDNSANNSASVSITPKLANLIVADPAAVCAPATVDLTAQSITAGSTTNLTLSYWTNSSATTSYSTPTTAAAGTYYIKATSSNGCIFIKPVVVTVNSLPNTPTISVESGSVSCSTTSVVLRSSGNSGSYLWSTGETTREITVTTDGSYSVKRINGSGCVGNSSAATIVTFRPSPPTASAQSFCSSEGKTVNNLIATGISLKWYDTNSSTPALAGSTVLATKTYYVSQTSTAGCESTRTAVAVTIGNSSAPVASAQSFCFSENRKISDLVASGANLKWYDTSTSTSPLATNTLLTTKTYYVTQTASSCVESAKTSVAVTINTIPSPPVASSQIFCGTDAKKVSDLVATGNNLKWYSANTGGTLYTGTETLSTGNYYVSQTTNCGESTRTSVAVTVNNTPVPTASSQIFCATDAKKVSDLVASGTNLKWYSTSTGGILYAGTDILFTGNYYVSQTLNSCESLRSLVAVTVNSTTAPIASSQTFCFSENKKVSDLISSGSNLKWYSTSTSESAFTGGEILSSGNYYVSQTLNGCESTRTLVAVTVNPTPPTPTISTSGSTTFCSGDSVILTSSGGNSYLWSTGATTQSITVSASGNYSVQVTNASGCQSVASAPITVTVNPIPSKPTISASRATTLCFGDSITLTSSSTTGNVWSTGATTQSITISTTGVYNVQVTNSGCSSTVSDNTSVTVNSRPSVPTVSTTAATCSAAGISSVSNYTSGLTYAFSPTGPTVSSTGAISNMVVGTSYTVTANNGSCTSGASASFSNAAMLSTAAVPTVSTTSATCSAAGSSSVSNYTSGLTYTFSPTGPTVSSTGAISNMVVGTSYTVTANNGSCTSGASASFSNAAMLSTAAVPTVSTTSATCSAAGSSRISNYTSGLTYAFSPTGPTVSSTGAISNMVVGTSYTVTANNGSCTSGASASFSNVAMLSTAAVPTVSTTAATCSAAGISSVSNYTSGLTYAFSPTGPTVSSTGAISNMVVGTSYTVTANNGSCTSGASASFSNAAMLSTAAVPTVSTTSATCSAAGSSSVSNYTSGLTYTFSPTGPTVSSTGAISNMVVGTSYTVTANNGSCTSGASASFSNAAMLSTAAVPTVSTTSATCSAAGSSRISNYTSGLTYAFSPTGPTVSSTGAISNMVVGTSYTVTANNGSCTSGASASFSNVAMLSTAAVPTVSTTAATCSAAGISSVSNYTSGLTYAFSPTGPTVSSTGAISNMVVGTSYTVTANNGSCTSGASASFSNAAMLSTAAVPTVSTTSATCSAAGSSSVSNYTSGLTYTFSPTGPTVSSTGAISNMVVGTSYTVTANNGSCTSGASASFSNAAMLSTAAVPTVSTTSATCSAAGSSSVSNYTSGLTYTFSPTGPTVSSTGAISNMVVGTSYTVTANNGSCTSGASASFSNAAMLSTAAVPTVSTTAATCSAAGISSVSNYTSGLTYAFSPTGPTVSSTGAISDMVVGTSYTVTANNGSCTSGASASFSNAAMLSTAAVPTVSTTAATCSAAGISSVSNYTSGLTYIFSPTGPTVSSTGAISNMTVGTSYTVTANNGSCTSGASASFNNAAMLSTAAVPTVSTTVATCSAAGSSGISNYTSGLTYVFNPTGPTVSSTGAISNMTVGTSYTVTANNGSCTSGASASFSNAAMLSTAAVPTVSTTAATCSAAGSSSVSNYTSGLTYAFSPTGPTVSSTGAISNMVVGTSYTVTANNGSCTSGASASFSNAAMLSTAAVPTVSTTAATCSAAGISSVSNYTSGLTYAFSPTGPTVSSTGAISNMVVGTSYTVTANNGSCTSGASASFSNAAMLSTAAVPTVSTTAATCSAAGISSVSNYTSGLTYAFSPTGPTVSSTGAISNMVVGTSYTVTANNGSCTSGASASFSNAAMMSTAAVPTVSTTSATCSAAGSSSVSNYTSGLTYTFSPTGPTVSSTGAISNMVVGTSYTVTANNGSCSSSSSTSFSNGAKLLTPVTPAITATAATCSVAGSLSITNYDSALTYTFNPTGPTITSTGGIDGVTIGTNYTLSSALSGNCTSESVSFVIDSKICAQDDNSFGVQVPGSVVATTVGNVTSNDTLNGVVVTPVNTNVTPFTDGPLSVDANGVLTLAPNTTSGTYTITYTICEEGANPANCTTAIATVVVIAPVIDAVKETTAVINGNLGGTTVSLVLNDTLNGNTVVIGTNPGEVILTGITVPTGLTLNATGTVSVAAGTPAGTYNVEYKICEVNNPTNCDNVISEVVVTGGNLVANVDLVGSTVGINQPTTLINVFSNDTNNSLPVVASNMNLSVVTADPTGFITLNSDGTAILGANAPAGTYELVYQICEKLNPTNCSSASIKVTVTAPVIDAVKETTAVINGNLGGTTASLILNDTLNGNTVVIGTNPGEVILTGITVPTGLTLNATGTVSVAAGTPAGTYNVEYKICEVNNPTNCDSVISEVVVTGGNLVANVDLVGSTVGINQPTTLINVFSNDTNNSLPVVASNMNLSVVTADPTGFITLNSDGTAILGANAPAGTYELVYQICEKLNPTNCSSASIKVTVTAPVIDAVKETTAVINGNLGGTTASLILNDTLNGNTVVIGTNPGEVILTGITVPTGLTLNATGTVSVAAGTPAGTYNVEYKICEVNNPTNCDNVISEVVVTGGNLVANVDLVGSTVGINQPTTLINVFANDTNNGLPVVATDMNLSVTTPDPTGFITLNSDGTAILGANAPAGTYELVYQICEKLNPTNCSSASIKVTVTAPTMTVTANSYCSNNVPYVSYNVAPDNFTPNNLLTVKWIDSANNVVATQTNLPLSGNLLWPGAITDSNGNGVDWPGWILANGQWTEGADGFENTRTGVTIQFSLNPTVNFAVNYPPATPQCNARPTFTIKSNNDNAGPIDTNKSINTALNIFDNDTLNGAAINPANAILSTVIANPSLILNADGSVDVKSGTPSGTYQLTYQICDTSNASSCSQAVVKVTVLNSENPPPVVDPRLVLVTKDDLGATVDGINGELEFINVLDNDLLNGVVINPTNVVISNTPKSPYFEFNSDGTVNVKPNTPGGNYTLIYQVCEKVNTSNCSASTLNVFVEVPAIAIVKTAVFNDENGNGFANAGETVTYKFKVTNTGNVPLTGVTVSDPLTGIILSGQPINLNVNESDETNFSAEYKITQNDINNGSVSNQASVQGRSAKGVVVDDKSDDVNNSGDNPTVLSLDGCQIKVLNGFSPNGDGKNARFYIQGLECYPDNTVEIYNRWGVLVFDIDYYNNEDRSFIGISAGRATIKQTDGLPVGTYFYILKYKDSASKQHELSGYLYMNK